MNVRVPSSSGYELLDSGDERKLERFGTRILNRPAPQAIWPRSDKAKWKEATAEFHRHETGQGEWTVTRGNVKDPWTVTLNNLSFELRLTGFGNVGLFPEHSAHWTWLSDKIRAVAKTEPARVLNLFGYTGGASMLCARAGAKVVHVDAAKAVNSWAIANAGSNGLPSDAVRCLSEDALKFVARELRKEKTYHGIIADPPTFGRGANGEIWKIENDFFPLLNLCQKLLTKNGSFILATSHSPGITPISLENLLTAQSGNVESGEMLLEATGHSLPSGVFARWTK